MRQNTLRYQNIVAVVFTLLVACSSNEPAAVRSLAEPGATISVTGPAGNGLKLGQTARFVAVYKTADGTAVFGKPFQWTSQSPDVAEVAPDGRVTARKLGTFRIVASSEGVAGSSSEQFTYGLEVTGGTFNEGLTNPGAALLVRLRGPNGQPPEVGTTITVKGPEGFNANNPLTGTYRANQAFDWTVSRVAPVPGTYTVTATVGGETLDGQFSSDFTTKLEPPANLDVIASTSRIDARWAAVSQARSYAVVVWRRNGLLLERILERYTSGTTLTLQPSVDLDPAGSYVLSVFPTTPNLDTATPAPSFDVAVVYRDFVPAAPSPRLSRFVGRWQGLGATPQIAKLDISASGTDTILELREACAQPECATWSARGLTYWATPQPAADAAAQAITATFVTPSARITLLLQPSSVSGSEQLLATVLTEFTDGSGRQPFTQTDILVRDTPPTPLSTP